MLPTVTNCYPMLLTVTVCNFSNENYCVIFIMHKGMRNEQKRTESDVHFLLQKLIMNYERQLGSNDSGLALFSCNQFEGAR